jgi:hypothetical protein
MKVFPASKAIRTSVRLASGTAWKCSSSVNVSQSPPHSNPRCFPMAPHETPFIYVERPIDEEFVPQGVIAVTSKIRQCFARPLLQT